jgi:Leucine-rich repeat (LRR) protein
MNKKNTQINAQLDNSTVNGSVVAAEQVNNSFNEKTEIDTKIYIEGNVIGGNVAGNDINITNIYNNTPSTYAFITLKRIITLLKNSTYEKIAFLVILALVPLAIFLQITHIPEFTVLQRYNISLIPYFLASLCFLFVCYRLILKLAISKPTEDILLPNAIKGLMAFTAEDGVLFRRLEREVELAQLKSHVSNPQTSLLVMMGESGSGKTSLLRAGLSNILKDTEVKYIYWEALPHESVVGLIKTIKQGLNLNINQLSDLLTSSVKAVIVLDQFEQLLPDKPEHTEIFNLLTQIALATPPHSVTWIIAFRREYLPYWRDFELDRKLKQLETISLKLFSLVQANHVMATLAEDAGLLLEQALVDNFINSVQHDGKLSPVDIGIGLLMLQELASQKQRQELNLADYQFAGGSQGLFVSFLKTKIEQRFVDKQEQEALFKALLELIDLQRNQRIAEGKTLIELAEKAQDLEPRLLEYALEHFASQQVRLLEKITHSDGTLAYRLPHESMISALRQLGNSLLGEVAQADLVLQTAFIAWQNSTQRNKRYLLSGKELTQVLQFQQQLNMAGKAEFLKQSMKQRTLKRWAIITSTLLFSIVSYSGYQTWQDYELESSYRASLKAWKMPENLRDYSEQITALSIEGERISSIDWLAKFKHLTTLELNLNNSQVTELSRLKELTTLISLNLYLYNTKITDLSELRELKNLATLNLYLDISKITDLSFLKELTNLTTLNLNLNGSQIDDLNVLKELTGLTRLDLVLDYQMTDLSSLKKLASLTTLNLNLNYSEITDLSILKELTSLTALNLVLNLQITDLSALKELTSLTTLNLNNLSAAQTDLSFLKKLTGLTTLNLDLNSSQITDLSVLKELTGLTALDLVLNYQITDLGILKEKTSLTTLNLNLGGSQITDLSVLKALTNLTTLNLNLSGSQVADLSILKELTGLTTLELNLFGSKITDLSVLKGLPNLTALNLNLGASKIADLSILKELTGLTKLELDLVGSEITELSVLKELTSLTTLKLNLSYSQITDLSALKALTSLTSLNLKVGDSKITDLTILKDIPAKKISLDISSSTQSNSLKDLPPSVTELTVGNLDN